MSQTSTSTTTPFDLNAKVAIVTGGSRGIGFATAMALAQGGAKVVIASRKPEPLEQAAAQLREATGAEVLAVPAHTGDDAAVERVVARACEAFGGVDVLVNNAATNPHFGPLLSADDSHWDKTYDVNVKGYFRMARACVPSMRERGGGRIINIASIAGRRVQPGMGIYCISKAAVIMLTQVLAVELADAHINVNALTRASSKPSSRARSGTTRPSARPCSRRSPKSAWRTPRRSPTSFAFSRRARAAS
nr:SDR family oxidoreductase [Pseudenhygromyxa sp. WMMC2535]